MLAGGKVFLGADRIGLLDELGDLEDAVDRLKGAAATNVAVAGLGALGLDAQTNDGAVAGGRRGAIDGGGEGLDNRDRMIRGEQQQQRLGVALGQAQRGGAGRRSGVAADRLEQHRPGCHRDLAQLFGDDEPVLFVGDDERRREALRIGDPPHRLLQQTLAAEQAQELLRVERTRHRPQPGARTAGQNDRVDHANPSNRRRGAADSGSRHTRFWRRCKAGHHDRPSTLKNV